MRCCFVDTILEFRSIRRMSLQRVHLPASRFSPPGPGGVPFPDFDNTIRTLRLPTARLAALRCLRLAIPFATSRPSLPPTQDVKAGGPGGLRVRHPPQPRFTVETAGSPKFLRNLSYSFAMFSDSGRTATLRPYKRTTWPPLVTRQGLPQGHFRSSIAWLLNSLSTLRRKGHPFAAQDSLPGAGRALLGGLGYPQGSDERFQL